MDKIEFENGFSEDSKAIITKIIEMRMLETDNEKQNIPTKDVGVGTLSDSDLSSLVSKLELDIPKLDMADILKDTINELGCKKELSKSTRQIHAEIKETSEKISNSQKTRPDFDMNYQNLMKKLKTKINYSFYDKLKSYFNPEKYSHLKISS